MQEEEGFDGRRAQRTRAGAQPHIGDTSPKREPAFTASKIICSYMVSLGDSFSIPLFLTTSFLTSSSQQPVAKRRGRPNAK